MTKTQYGLFKNREKFSAGATCNSTAVLNIAEQSNKVIGSLQICVMHKRLRGTP